MVSVTMGGPVGPRRCDPGPLVGSAASFSEALTATLFAGRLSLSPRWWQLVCPHCHVTGLFGYCSRVIGFFGAASDSITMPSVLRN